MPFAGCWFVEGVGLASVYPLLTWLRYTSEKLWVMLAIRERGGSVQRTKKYTLEQVAALLPWPDEQANKYSRGKVVLVAGCADYPGAACLAATASQRMGAGYTEVACAAESVAQVRAASPSLVVRPWDELTAYAQLDPDERGIGVLRADGARQPKAAARLAAARPARTAPRPRVLGSQHPAHPLAFLVGSGMDAHDPLSAQMTCAVLADAAAPVLVDGGGLDALTTPDGRLLLRRRFIDGLPTVITPHAGEAARLAAPLALPTDDPAHLAKLLSLAYGVTAVVKGPVTYISDGETVFRMSDGTSALAKAGTGDVLAGMVAALLAQKLAPVDACVLGTTLHARAARLAAKRLTSISVVAEDVVAAIPEAIASVAGERG